MHMMHCCFQSMPHRTPAVHIRGCVGMPAVRLRDSRVPYRCSKNPIRLLRASRKGWHHSRRSAAPAPQVSPPSCPRNGRTRQDRRNQPTRRSPARCLRTAIPALFPTREPKGSCTCTQRVGADIYRTASSAVHKYVAFNRIKIGLNRIKIGLNRTSPPPPPPTAARARRCARSSPRRAARCAPRPERRTPQPGL